MGRKVVRLTVDHLPLLPGPCGRCLFWELDPVRRGRVAPEDAAGEKAAWVSWVLREWGSCGRVVLVDDRPAAWAVYAPPAFVPGAEAFPTAPVGPDAVLLTTAYVDARDRGGLGRVLVQAVARDLVTRGGVRAVEAFGRHGAAQHRVDQHRLDRHRVDQQGGVLPEAPPARVDGVEGPPAGAGCLLPVDFLAGVGFGTQRAHPVVPRMRMDLRTALTWRGEVEAAVDRLRGAVRPVRAVRPAHAPRPTRATRVGRSGRPLPR